MWRTCQKSTHKNGIILPFHIKSEGRATLGPRSHSASTSLLPVGLQLSTLPLLLPPWRGMEAGHSLKWIALNQARPDHLLPDSWVWQSRVTKYFINTSLLNFFKSPIKFGRWEFLLFCCTDDRAKGSRKLHYAHVVTKSRKSTGVSVPRLSVLPFKLSSFL